MAVKGPRLVLLALSSALVVGACLFDLPGRSGGRFWSDGATYDAMAQSLARDFDLRYEVRDLLRIEREFEKGPGGLILKRGSGGLVMTGAFPFVRRVRPEEGVLYYGKAFLYPLLAAPFVRVLGTRGLLLANALLFASALFFGYSVLRDRRGPWEALALLLTLFGATATPLYLLWLTPEIMDLALITAALWAFVRKKTLLAAILLGLATYAKPTNALLALPLGLEPWWQGGGTLGERFRESARRALLTIATALLLFGANIAFTGEWNYQGGDRKAFDNCFPFASDGATFDRCGEWMTTRHLGPLVGKEGEGDVSGEPLSSAEVGAAFRANLVYFWIGRFGGALPYDAPILVALVFFLAWDRSRPGFLIVLTLLLSAIAYIVIIPANWYGGGAALGNRYFTNLLPLGLLLVPCGRAKLYVPLSLALGLFFVAPLLAAPLEHSLDPGGHATREPFLSLPIELTELNDLSIFMEGWRKKRPFGDTVGDRSRNWPADPKAYYLYFPDNGTRGKESLEGQEGFWVKGGRAAEVVLRSLEPVREVRLRVTGGPLGDRLQVSSGQGERMLGLKPDETAEIPLPSPPGMPYYGTFVQTLHFRSESADPLGTFIAIHLEVVPRQPRKASAL